jgi:hypothetical protein
MTISKSPYNCISSLICRLLQQLLIIIAPSIFRIRELKVKKGKAVPLHAMEALGGKGGIAPTHSRPLH